MSNSNHTISRAYSEVYEILSCMDEKYLNRIPKKFLQMIKENKDDAYQVVLSTTKPLEEQELLPDTINILAMIKLDYLCENESEKQELRNILNVNEQKYRKEMKEKYNIDNIFKKQDSKINDSVNMSKPAEENLPVKFKENFFYKFKNFFKRLFNRDALK